MRFLRCSVLFVLACWPRPASAQWGLSAEIGTLRFSGGTADTSGLSVHPYRSTGLGIGVDREFGGTRIGLEVRYAKTGLGGEGRDVAFVDYEALSMIEIAPLVSLRAARFGQDLSLRFEAGPVIDIWRPSGEDPRVRTGGRAGVMMDWPLARRLRGAVRVSAALLPTVFEERDLEGESAELRPMWRTSVALAARYRL